MIAGIYVRAKDTLVPILWQPVNSTMAACATAKSSNEELLPVYYSQLYVHEHSSYKTLQELRGVCICI